METSPISSLRKIDLHLHSHASDGSLSPSQLVDRAHARGIEIMALTDHDTVQGLAEAKSQADVLGIGFIPGIELSCVWQGMTLHLVGLNIDPGSAAMRQAEETQQANRLERARVISERLAKQNLGDPWQALYQPDSMRVPARPDFARYLVEGGYVDSIQQAFERYLGAGKIGDVKQFWPALDQATRWITSAGGVPVLAHPIRYKLTTAKLRRLLEEFKVLGGQGLEVAIPNVDSGRLGMLAEFCGRYGLAASCGSDFHSPGRPWQDIGCFPPLPASVRPVWALWE